MLANEYLIEEHLNDFDFKWMEEQENSLAVTSDNYEALADSIKLVNCALNNISKITGVDNMREYLAKALNEMLDVKYIMEIELDRQRRGIA